MPLGCYNSSSFPCGFPSFPISLINPSPLLTYFHSAWEAVMDSHPRSPRVPQNELWRSNWIQIPKLNTTPLTLESREDGLSEP